MLNPVSLTVLDFDRAECVAQFGRSRGLTALTPAQSHSPGHGASLPLTSTDCHLLLTSVLLKQ